MLIGYARVSTPEQSIETQRDALFKYGCSRVFGETASGKKTSRPALDEALSHLREGDTLVVWRLDRLGRSSQHLIALVNELSSKKIEFKSIHENIDTSTSTGKLIFHVFSALAEFERALISERTSAALASARKRGIVGGRKKILTSSEIKRLKEMYAQPKIAVKDICKAFGISRTSLYRYIK